MKKAKQRGGWVYAPQPQGVPEALKAEVEARMQELVETVLKPKYVRPTPNPQFNHLVNIRMSWHQNRFLYLVGVYRTPGPEVTSQTFESKFARMEHVGNGRFNLAYLRHTGQWWPLDGGLTLDECLERVREGGHYAPA